MTSSGPTGPDGRPLPDLAALLGDGGDSIEDLQAMLDERMAAFNELPFEERKRLTDPGVFKIARQPIELPFTYVPPPLAEVEASLAGCEIVRQVDGYARYVGESGMPLTDSGNIKLADARKLVALLDTGDKADPEIRGEVHPTRSSLELRWLTLIDDLATGADAVSRLKTRVKANPHWFETDLLNRATSLADIILDAGFLGSRSSSELFHDLHQLIDDGVPHWFSSCLIEGRSVLFDEILDVAISVAEARFVETRKPILNVDDFVAGALADLIDGLARFGLLEWRDRVMTTNGFGRQAATGGELFLTAFGRHVLPGHVRRAGYAFPSIDDLSDAEARVVVDAVTSGSIDGRGLLDLWRPSQPNAARAQALADIAVDGDASDRLSVFQLLEELDDAVAVAPIVRQLLDTPSAGHAATFLLQNGLATHEEVGRFLTIGPLVDLLWSATHDPETFDEVFREAHATIEADLIEELWHHDVPETIEVLDSAGKHVTDKSLAKSARKAAIRHRTWLANKGR